MKMENEAYKTIWIVFSVTLTMFIVGPILSCGLFKHITTSFHQCHDVIAEEIEKEKALKNKGRCWESFPSAPNLETVSIDN